MNGEYVIVPFDALQVSFDERQRTNLLTLGVTLDNLQRAPRLAVNRWSSLRDRQFFTGAKQFYQRIERTAARPQIGGVPEGAKPGEGGITRQPSNGQLPAPTPPRSEPPAANEPDTMKEPAPSIPPSEPSSGSKAGKEPQPEVEPPQPELAAPAKSPETAPQKSNPEPRKLESNRDR